MKIEIRKCTGRDIKAMKGKLRKEDCVELEKATGGSPYKALVLSYRFSEKSWVGIVDGEIACAWGVSKQSLLGNRGTIWLLSTDVMGSIPLQAAIHTKRELKKIEKDYGYLENYVDATYVKCIRWLKWLGFTIEEPKPWGRKKELFCHFYKGTK